MSTLNTPIINAAQQQAQLAALPAPSLANLNFGGSAPAVSAPPLMPQVSMSRSVASSPNSGDSQIVRDQTALNNLRTTSSGVDQIKNPLLHGIAKTADIAASIFTPGLARRIPGTDENHNFQIGRAQTTLQQDQAQQQAQAQLSQTQALAQQEQARAAAITDPQKAVDPSKTVTTDDGVYQLNPQTGKYDIRVGDRVDKAKPIEQQAFEYAISKGQNPLDAYNSVYNAKNTKTDPLPQQYLDALKSGDQTKADLIKQTIQATQVQPKIDVHAADSSPNTGSFTLAQMPDGNGGTKSVLLNTKTGEVKDAPAGLSKQSPAGNAKIGADEQKRADLAQNMNENINQLEDILTRRPDLFGPVAGRMTQAKVAFGTDDQDAAKLITLEHQLGMVAQGAHGMRSAQGVESAANSLVNGFKNSPQATKAALEAARQSVATFQGDSAHPGQARSGPGASAVPPPGATHIVPGSDGHNHYTDGTRDLGVAP